jgi:phosphoserine phosphatase
MSPPPSPGLVLQGITAPLRLSDFKLIAFDMDSTLINIECIDEIADAAGRKAEVAAITEAAMRGEIADYKASLRQRVALLRGVGVAQMQQVLDERLRLNPGAAALVRACKAAGLKTLLVSGGFTFFTDAVQAMLGIDWTRSNVLEVQDGLLTGRLVEQAWGDICDGEEKRRMLLQTCAGMGIAPAQAIRPATHQKTGSGARRKEASVLSFWRRGHAHGFAFQLQEGIRRRQPTTRAAARMLCAR